MTTTPYEAATALELEARRRNMKRKQARRRGHSKGQTCADCARWQPDPQSRAGGNCPFPLKGSDLPKYKSRKEEGGK